ncbi:MAG TPA: hypothetical protein VIO80_03940 [Candidatus Dormibacteraeota bacterium]
MITTLLNRLGNLGLLLIACALLLGGLAGAAVAHHYDRLAAATSATQHNGTGDGAQKPKNRHGDQKHPNHGHRNGALGSDPAETG